MLDHGTLENAVPEQWMEITWQTFLNLNTKILYSLKISKYERNLTKKQCMSSVSAIFESAVPYSNIL